jgi:[histone H3]-dimethyl-L-lysine9 demethylase
MHVAQMVIVDPTAGSVHPDTTGLHPELQFARCMSNRYRSEVFPRCVSCTRRWAGDTCRFQAIRFFLKDSQRNIVGVSFVENQKPDAPTMQFPVQWNVPLEPVHFRRTKVGMPFLLFAVLTQFLALLPVLKRESEHLNAQGIIIRPRESDVRTTCGEFLRCRSIFPLIQ